MCPLFSWHFHVFPACWRYLFNGLSIAHPRSNIHGVLIAFQERYRSQIWSSVELPGGCWLVCCVACGFQILQVSSCGISSRCLNSFQETVSCHAMGFNFRTMASITRWFMATPSSSKLMTVMETVCFLARCLWDINLVFLWLWTLSPSNFTRRMGSRAIKIWSNLWWPRSAWLWWVARAPESPLWPWPYSAFVPWRTREEELSAQFCPWKCVEIERT